ncbi:MAG: phosphoglycerate dehydrogenase [Planctomycetes bacterium RBG_13_63_9]|nr:MAG: phosphoglycerate dehydrogenase [Planctomycetes bacterium RBG_13_63_9]
MKIVLCYPVEEHHRRRIAAVAPGAEIIDAGQERIAEELFHADIFCGHAKVPVDWDGVVQQGRLQWIQSSAAGMDHCLVPAVIESDIVVTSASAVLANQVAEHTIALVTAWCRSLPTFFRAQQQREFIRRPTRDLTRSTVGIVGLGGVGRRLAQLLAAFRTRILATDAFPVEKPDCVEALWPADRLVELLPLVDVLVLSLPLSETTRGMIDASALARMKPGSLLVNVARGPLLVTDDLVEVLRSGHLAGAVVDVTDPEPLPPTSELWDMPNVIITPHVGGQSARRIDDMTDLFCCNLRRRQAGQPLINYLSDKTPGFPIRGAGIPLWGNDGMGPEHTQ